MGFYGYNSNGDFGQPSVAQQSYLDYFENELPTRNYFTKLDLPNKYRNDCNFFNISNDGAGNDSRVPVEAISKSCYSKNIEESKYVFIWGNSHASQLYYGLSKTLPIDFEVLQVASSSCPASTEAKSSRVDYCEQSNWFAFNAIKKN